MILTASCSMSVVRRVLMYEQHLENRRVCPRWYYTRLEYLRTEPRHSLRLSRKPVTACDMHVFIAPGR